MSKSIAMLAGLMLALSACVSSPTHDTPVLAVPADFSGLGGRISGGVDETAFWERFEDSALSVLVVGALRGNHDLRAAVARIDQAWALAGLTGRDRLPSLTAQAHSLSSRTPAELLPAGAARKQDQHATGLVAAWELDLFGRLQHALQASNAEYRATAADLRALQVLISAEVSRSYFALRGSQALLALAQAHAGNHQQILELTRNRHEAGRGSELDVARAEAQLATTRATVPVHEADIAAAIHRLAVLNGRLPTELVADLGTYQSLPSLPAKVAVGTPAELLRRRPDLQAAEQRLAAATARVGVATADLFPRVLIGGQLGSAASSLGDLYSNGSTAASGSLAISWAFLDLDRVRARIRAQEAAVDELSANYQAAVLRALEETETALARYHGQHRRIIHLSAAEQSASRAAALARLRFAAGGSDFLQVLDAERTVLAAAETLSESRTAAAIALVEIYRAVAGSWSVPAPATEHEALPPANTVEAHSGKPVARET